ncbi:MAG: tetraacyldisaccharide 4'-kinase [Desulfuromonas sp.]|nr:MAG: tetraacyldisaccharide 4'-kinase [Desulfuromonas sp.]
MVEWGLFCAMVPFGLIYGGIAWLRSMLYGAKVLPSYRSRIPVISVGNIAVGGTGKTPFVNYLLGYFENRGIRPAVVSRGYGGTFSGRCAVVSDGNGPLCSPAYCGDEPFLLAQKHLRSLIMIAPKRKDAIVEINAEKKADVIILDDAFQHQQVARDLNVVLLDERRPYGNGFPLPAGLLREFHGALRRADLLVMTRATKRVASNTIYGLPAAVCRHQISSQMTSLAGQPVGLNSLKGQRGLAFAGIANPQLFFLDLLEMGLTLTQRVEFPDHAIYSGARLEWLRSQRDSVDYYVTTEKDAVKLSNQELGKPCYVASLQLDFFDKQALDVQLEMICKRIQNEIE